MLTHIELQNVKTLFIYTGLDNEKNFETEGKNRGRRIKPGIQRDSNPMPPDWYSSTLTAVLKQMP